MATMDSKLLKEVISTSIEKVPVEPGWKSISIG